MFCPACAAAVEPGAASCPNCGEALGVAPVVAPGAPMVAVPFQLAAQPAAVRRAVTLLWVSFAIGVLTVVVSLIALIGRLHSFGFAGRLLVFPILWVVAIYFTMRGNNLGRMAVIVLVAYMVFNLIRFRANPGVIVSLVELALRGYAVYLLLLPESNAWFTGQNRGT